MRAQQSEWSNCWNLALCFLSPRLGTRLGRWVTLQPRTQSLLLHCPLAQTHGITLRQSYCPETMIFAVSGPGTEKQPKRLPSVPRKSIGIVRTNQKHDMLPALWFRALSIVAPLAVTMGWLGRVKAWNFWVLPPVPSLLPFK